MFQDLKTSIKVVAQENPLEDVEGVEFSGTCYHGTAVTEDTVDHIYNLERGHGDDTYGGGALWVTPEETYAEEFAIHVAKKGSTSNKDVIPVVFEVVVDVDYMLYLEDISNPGLRDAIQEYYVEQSGIAFHPGELDLDMFIDDIIEAGFDSWLKLDQIWETDLNTEIAIFDSRCYRQTGVKLFIDGKWTDYMDPGEAAEIVKPEEDFEDPEEDFEDNDYDLLDYGDLSNVRTDWDVE